MIDDRITLKKLEIFSAFMETENINKTAEKLGISTVSVHRALHSLEEGMRVPLFVHVGRNLESLPTAKVLISNCHSILAKIERAIEDTQIAGGIGANRIRLGTMYSLTTNTVPSLITGVKLRSPGIEFDLHMGSNAYLVDLLSQNKLDAILIDVGNATIDMKSFEVLPLFVDNLYLAAKASNQSEVLHDEVDLKDFKDETFITLTEGFATYSDFKRAFEIAGFLPQSVTKVQDIFSLANLVGAGVGYAILPGRIYLTYSNALRFYKLDSKYQLHQTIAIVFNRSREMEHNLRVLVAEGRRYARERKLTTISPDQD